MTGCRATAAPCRSKTIRRGEVGESRGGCDVCLKGDIRAHNYGGVSSAVCRVLCCAGAADSAGGGRTHHMELIAVDIDALEDHNPRFGWFMQLDLSWLFVRFV